MSTVSMNLRRDSRTRGWVNCNVLFICAGVLFSLAAHEAAAAVLPLFIMGMGAGPAALGIIEGVAGAAAGVVRHVVSPYQDMPGERKGIAFVASSLAAVSNAALGVVVNWMSVLPLRATAGAARVSVAPLRDAMLGSSLRAETYRTALAFRRLMLGIGAVTGPAVALMLMRTASLQNILLLTFIPGALGAATIALVKDCGLSEPRLRLRCRLSQLPASFRTFLYVAGVFGLADVAHTLLLLRAVEILRPGYGPKANVLAVGLYTLHNLGYAVVSVALGRYAESPDVRTLLIIGYLLFAAVAVGFAYAESLRQLGVLFTGAAIALGIVEAVESSYAARLLPFHLRGFGLAVLGLINAMGDLMSNTVVGWLWVESSAEVAFVYAGGLALAGAGMLLIRDDRTSSEPQLV